MASPIATDFWSGVIEGFYGTLWTQSERFELFEWMRAWGLNTYQYGPKDDLKHRALWRECYTEAETQPLRELIEGCHSRGLRFAYALGPGLDIRYSLASDRQTLIRRFEQMLKLGCRNFCLLFDDIPDQMDPSDREYWGSFASAHAGVANEVFRWVRSQAPDAGFVFCPTPYCGRMASRRLGGVDYLATVGRELLPEIQVFWTGPEIISREITVESIRDLQALLRRKPMIWDNLQANDYDGHRFFCGPYSGRSLELRSEVRGILLNPNTEFSLNRVPIQTFADYLQATEDWNPRQSYLRAMKDWLPRFATVGQPITLEDLLLLGDCYYLPHEMGPGALDLSRRAADLLSRDPATWGDSLKGYLQLSTQLRECCVRVSEVRHRPIFHALSRRVWELREELDLLERYLRFKADPKHAGLAFASDFHQVLTYRGGTVAGLQRLLVQQPDGTLVPRDSGDVESKVFRTLCPT